MTEDLERSSPAQLVRADTDGQLIALWLQKTTRSVHTHRAYTSDVKRFRAAIDKPLRALTLEDALQYVEVLADYAPSTRQRRIAAIRSLCSFGVTVGYLRFNVFAAVRMPAVPRRLAERIPTEADVWRVITMTPPGRERLLLLLLYYLGGRADEVAGLRWRDLAERDRGGQATIVGKGEHERVVLIPPDVWRELQRARGAAEADAPVLPSRGGGRLSYSQVWRLVKAAAARAGVPDLSPHWLRHANATHALDRGAPLHVVRDSLGHGSLATTGRYLHARPGDGSALYLRPLAATEEE